jgi:hypothetical protein
MDGSRSTIARVKNLIDTTDLNVLRLATLCGRFGIKGTSDASLTRALQKMHLSNAVDVELDLFIRRIESWIEAAQPYFKISFEDLDYAEVMLRLLEGVHFNVSAKPIAVQEVTTISSDNITDGGDRLNSSRELSNDRRSEQ